MKKEVYTAARKSRFLFTPFTLVILFLPAVLLLGCMIWGDGFFLSFLGTAAAVATLGYAAYRLWVTARRKNMSDDAALARWAYSREYWREYCRKAFKPGRSFAVQIAICVALFLLFIILPRAWVIIPWTKTKSIASLDDAWLDAIVLIVVLAWSHSLIRKWLPMRYPGEAVLAHNGIYTRYAFIKWRGRNLEFDGAVLEKGASSITVHYRKTKGAVSRTQMVTLTIPVPPEYAAQAEETVKKINTAAIRQQAGHSAVSL